MIERNFQSRIINKHDVEKNWNKAINFIPKKGEFIIYDIDENYDYPRLKVGDGATVVGQLPFVDRDIRNSITELTIRLNALADSDDTTLDQLSEIVAYIKSNKDLISAITTDKVSIEDIIDNLTTNSTDKPLSAAQGMRLKELVDAKVNKVEGKGLSSNDYTDAEKTKLAGIQEGAVASWNDLNDKPFGEETSPSGEILVNRINPKYLPENGFGYTEFVKDELVYELDVTIDNQTDECVYYVLDSKLQLAVDEKYLIQYNGIDYICGFNETSGTGYIYEWFGNQYLAHTSHADTGEPFAYRYMYFHYGEEPEYSIKFYFLKNTSNAHSVKIYKFHKIDHSIDTKYLPDGIGYGGKELLNTTLSSEEQWKDIDLIGLREGMEYTVNHNGIEYSCVCHSVYDTIGVENLVIGDSNSITNDYWSPSDMVFPFIIGDDNVRKIGFIGTLDEGATIKVKEAIHRIDWQYLPEGTVYEETHTSEILIEYDGDSTGKPIVDLGEDGILVKVSDLTPEPSELTGATATVGGQSMTITAEDIYDWRPEGAPGLQAGEVMVVLYSPLMGTTETGMYILDMGIPASLQYTAVTNVHKINPKLLPEGGFGYNETEIHKIDDKFIPDTIARVSDVEAAQSAANAYTDKKVAEGSGSAETAKIIDLTQYGNSNTTLNDMCLSLYASGGGVDALNDMAGTFMDDIDSSATIKIDATSLGYIIESDVKSIIKLTDGSTQTAETSFLAVTGEEIRESSIVTIVFHRGGQSSVGVLVSVEPLTIPS